MSKRKFAVSLVLFLVLTSAYGASSFDGPLRVWKSFLRGYNPLFMDPHDGVALVGNLVREEAKRSLTSPFGESDVVLYLKKTSWLCAEPSGD